MMAGPGAVRRSFATAVCCAMAAVAAWCWRGTTLRTVRTEPSRESPSRVSEQFPLFEPPTSAVILSAEFAEAVVRANPFSPQRRQAPPPEPSSGQGNVASALPPAQFVYKGQVNLGKRRRAVVEETTSRKTYFLEVGQEVAGFKVLDIGENRVVLSNSKTSEEIIVTLATSAAQQTQQ